MANRLKWQVKGEENTRTPEKQRAHEFNVAKAYFDANPEATKMDRKQDKSVLHSFIKSGGQVLAIGSRRCADENLGKGGFGIVKVAENEAGENYARKVEKMPKWKAKDWDKSDEFKITQEEIGGVSVTQRNINKE